MSCPTCDHTMQIVAGQVSWCPRCGTIKMDNESEAPTLVGRCRTFENLLNGAFLRPWIIEGIAESINVPVNRNKSRCIAGSIPPEEVLPY